MSSYLNFCSDSNSKPFPTFENLLLFYVATLSQRGLKGATIKSYLAAIRYTQISLGMGNPQICSMPRLEYVVKGAHKASAGPTRTCLPITPDILRAMQSFWNQTPNRFNASMLWAASCMSFYGFLRSGEVVVASATAFDPSADLSYGDVAVDNVESPHFLSVRIKTSKTDPFREGVTVYLGVTGCSLCPVTAILSYMVLRGGDSGPFFLFENGDYLSRDRFVRDLRSALSAVSCRPQDYACHSYRIGAATAAARAGVADSLIQTLGRWQSSAFQLYIRTPWDTLCAVSRTLVNRQSQ